MSGREWKPGDVAMVTGPFTAHRATSQPAVRDGDGWHSLLESSWLDEDDVTAARPLLIIDPENGEQVSRLVVAHGDRGWIPRESHGLRDALRSLIEPPRPEEPTGLGAVVEDANGERWVRREQTQDPWINARGGNFHIAWSAMTTAVTVLSEGVQP